MKLVQILRNIIKSSPFEGLMYRLCKSRYPSHVVCKLLPNHSDYQYNSVRQVKRNGISFELDLSDLVDWYIFYGLRDEGREKLMSLILKADIIYDIGANVGEVSLLASRNAKVISFEPHPGNYKRFEKNVRLNNNPANLTLVNKGLGLGTGRLKMSSVKGNQGMNYVSNEGEEVEITTLEDAVRKYGKPDLIKVDTEGYEMNVLKGGENFLRNNSPILFIEIDSNNLKRQGSSIEELCEFLTKLGYRIAPVDGSILDFNQPIHIDAICQKE